MLSRLRSCGGVLLVLLVAAVAEGGVVAKGTQELMGSFAWDRLSVSEEEGDASLSLLQFTPTYGYFFLDNLEAQFRVTVASVHASEEIGSNDSDYSATVWSPQVLALVHLPASDRYFPYAGLGLGWSFFSDSEGTESESTTLLPIVCGGSKILITERAAVNIEVYYMHHENALYIEDLDASQFGITVGLSLLLRSQVSSEPRETLWEKTERELAN